MPDIRFRPNIIFDAVSQCQITIIRPITKSAGFPSSRKCLKTYCLKTKNKLLIWKVYHTFIYISQCNKQNGTGKVLPPWMVPTSGPAHGLFLASSLAVVHPFRRRHCTTANGRKVQILRHIFCRKWGPPGVSFEVACWRGASVHCRLIWGLRKVIETILTG